MCGIWAVFGLSSNLHTQCAGGFMKICHRGPDAWRVEYNDKLKNCCIGFHRLTIVDCTYGMQPMKLHKYPHSMLICNGELYNCKRLDAQYSFGYETYSDVECIFHLYQKFGIEECVQQLDGVFAFCLIDLPKRKVVMGRDPYGVRPLFRLSAKCKNDGCVLAVSSEAKGLLSVAAEFQNGDRYVIEPFPPGTYAEYDILEDGKTKLVKEQRYFWPGDRLQFQPFVQYEDLSQNSHLANIRTLLTAAVNKRLMADRRIGCLLSGGLDSSLIAALLVQEAKNANLPYKIQSFSVGMGDSPDVRAARQVAEFIGTEHHEIIFTDEDIAQVLDDVIYTLETPDITTIRASIPMYLVSRYIKQHTETTVLFSGEGADELAQGYIYFRDAPDVRSAHEDSVRLLREIYMFDGLRADRTMAAHSLELRAPFLDIQFTSYYLGIEAKLRQPKDGIEKHLLRTSFNEANLLPHEILWRHKEAFSDGVTTKTKSLFVILQELIAQRCPGRIFRECESAEKYPHCTPKTLEQLYYREVFERHYAGLAMHFLPHFWMPRWVMGVTDPSARFIKHYAAPQK